MRVASTERRFHSREGEVMRLIDRLKAAVSERDKERDEGRSSGDEAADKQEGSESLPGGASGEEAAAASPQRAAELAD